MNTFKVLGLFLAVLAFVYGDDDCVCRKCQYALASKINSLNGDFITPDQNVRMIDVSSGKYVNGTSLHDILAFFKENSDQFITTAQINQMLAVNTQISQILGSSNATLQFMRLGMNLTLQFISNDKATIDAAIATSKANGDDFDTQKQVVCRTVFTLMTPEKRQALSQELLSHITTAHREAVIAAINPIMKVDNVDTSNIAEASDGVLF